MKDADLHIAFGVDANYLPPMAAAIISIADNNPELKLAFHVMATDFSQEDRDKLAGFAREKALTIQVHDTDDTKLAKLPDPTYLTRATYNRLLLCDALAAVTDRILYLDADIICLADISRIASLSMEDKIVAAVVDADQDKRKVAANLSGEDPYFNAGVLLIDVAKWNARGVTDAVLNALVKNYRRFPMLDQDALNAVLSGDVLFLDRAWNLLIDDFPVSSDTVFLHYAGAKPWQEWSGNYRDSRFISALARTPWADWRSMPKSRKHRNKYAQHLLEEKRIVAGVYWYLLFMLTPKKRG